MRRSYLNLQQMLGIQLVQINEFCLMKHTINGRYSTERTKRQLILVDFCRNISQYSKLIFKETFVMCREKKATMWYKEVWLFLFDSINRNAYITNKAKLVK